MSANSTLNSNETFLRSQAAIKESEEISRYLDKRVSGIEKSFSSLTTELIGFARRTAKLRNNGDKINDILNEYVCNELLNNSTTDCLKTYCYRMSIIEDLRNLEFNRIKDHLIVPMLDYNGSLKKIKTEIKKEMDARKKELTSQKKLNKSLTGNSAKEAKARSSTDVASINAITQSEKLLKMVNDFEKRKLEHIQTILKSFINIEMLWHMRALEQCSEAYGPLQVIDCHRDLDQFLDSLRHFRSQDHLSQSRSNLKLNSRRSQSMDNLKMRAAHSQGDLSGRNELRASVTFDDQHQRSQSFQNPGTRDSMVSNRSQPDISKARPPLANGSRPVSQRRPSDDQSDPDSEDYTDDGTTTATRTASVLGTNYGGGAPTPQKRGR